MNRETGPPESLGLLFLGHRFSIKFSPANDTDVRAIANLKLTFRCAEILRAAIIHLMNIPAKIPCAILLLAVLGLTTSARAETSALWGTNGELWSASSRLPDFSYAGYHCGEAPLPDVAARREREKIRRERRRRHRRHAGFSRRRSPPSKTAPLKFRRAATSSRTFSKSSAAASFCAAPGRTKPFYFFPMPLQDNQARLERDHDRPQRLRIIPGPAASSGSRAIWANAFWRNVICGGETRRKHFAPFHARKICAPASALKFSKRTIPTIRSPPSFTPATPATPPISSAAPTPRSSAASRKLTATRFISTARCVLTSDCSGIRKSAALSRPSRNPAWKISALNFRTRLTPAISTKSATTPSPFPASPIAGRATCVITNADSGIFPGGDFCTIQNIVLESARRARRRCCIAPAITGFVLEGDDNLFTGFDFRTRFVHDISRGPLRRRQCHRRWQGH